MVRCALVLAGCLAAWSAASTHLPAQEPAPKPPAAQPPTPQPAEVEIVEATKEETWTLGGQQWDFKEIASTYKPVKGALNAKTGVAQWTLEIVKEMSDGEIGLHENLEGSPFKPAFLDAERVAVQSDAVARISQIAGKVGDRITLAVKLPPPELLEKVTLVRLGRRTNVGF
jgi:hypothetical protein